ncbi:MAG: nicotinate (nicotinamide) nucleotide adenylyltransferase [Phycisphaerales bacterium]|nr:nicotinate (nicotinamide) nucleotide adenylyltransferase [Phycisphaerales bacterium]
MSEVTLLFGGSFDPPHARHVSLLHDAMRAVGATRAIVIPARLNPLKRTTPPTAGALRLEMCKLAFDESAGNIRVHDLELKREGASFTIDTVESLLRRGLCTKEHVRLIVGSDAMRSFTRWSRWNELLKLATPAVIARPPDTLESTREFLESFAEETGWKDAPSWLLPLEPVELSSTGIREALTRWEQPEGVCESVLAVISREKLYEGMRE